MAIAIGSFAGQFSQGNNAIAIGNYAGRAVQGASSVAIGNLAGLANMGAASVLIGTNAIGTVPNSVGIGNGVNIGSAAFVQGPVTFLGAGNTSMTIDYPVSQPGLYMGPVPLDLNFNTATKGLFFRPSTQEILCTDFSRLLR